MTILFPWRDKRILQKSAATSGKHGGREKRLERHKNLHAKQEGGLINKN
ncbi:hypothetical protein [Duncaniella dubosii]|nr:hypothetical protein [Duncaniella dubosii]MCX4283496.1 hypothetical protein [Duncaniella dubosii]